MNGEEQVEKATQPKFGTWMRGIYASERNPQRDGMYVRTIVRQGRVNPGTYYELTDGNGNFWECPKDSVEFITQKSFNLPVIQEMIDNPDTDLFGNDKLTERWILLKLIDELLIETEAHREVPQHRSHIQNIALKILGDWMESGDYCLTVSLAELLRREKEAHPKSVGKVLGKESK